MCMFLPMEVITITKPVDTVLHKYHDYTQIKKKISEEKVWLKESEKMSGSWDKY